jgi:hypothetical protein
LLRKFFLWGAAGGSLMSLLLLPLMYMTALRPTGRSEEILLAIASILWPTSPTLMAVQPTSSMFFRVATLGIAILSNGLLYGLVAGIVAIVLGRLGMIARR